MDDAWSLTYEGRYSRETYTRADRAFRVEDRTAGWSMRVHDTLRPYCVLESADGRHFHSCRHLGLGLYRTAEAAMRAVDKRYPMPPAAEA